MCVRDWRVVGFGGLCDMGGFLELYFRLFELSMLCSQQTAPGQHNDAQESRKEEDSNLVDPASSHMLVSKIKPCMSKYKLLYGETANGSLKQL